MQITLTEDRTVYHGKKEKIAVVTIAGRAHKLGLGDTHRCAQLQEASARLLTNLAAAANAQGLTVNGEAARLTAHCRELVGIKDNEPK